MRRSHIIVAAAALACALAGSTARADADASHPATVRQAHPWGFGASFSWLPTGRPAFASVGVAAERALGRWFALDLALENGLATSAADDAATRLDPRLLARLGARATLPLERQERVALFASAGPALLVGNAYDRLPLAHLEAGVALRTWSGLSLLGAAVANFALARRQPVVPPADCLLVCDGPIAYGTRSIGFRIGVGAAF
ncbi:MAG TPA: hypothetical protein VIF57_27325 [Polyangia bacterium]|jgi:hypothetical protein